MIVGLKRLDKEDLKKACMELHHWLSSWRLGNMGSNLCASAPPFVPLATSPVTGNRPQGVGSVPAQVPTPPVKVVTQPLYTSEDEGATTEAVTPKKKNRKQGSRGRRSKKGFQSETCDSSSEMASSSTRVPNSPAGRRWNKKKGGINNKVHIPEFDGKTSNTEGVGEAFHRWS